VACRLLGQLRGVRRGYKLTLKGSKRPGNFVCSGGVLKKKREEELRGATKNRILGLNLALNRAGEKKVQGRPGGPVLVGP